MMTIDHDRPAPVVEVRATTQAAAAPPLRRDPVWTRWALPVLLLSTALLYLWGLSRNGWANAYYTAAAQAGSVSWKAWFFGAFDGSGFITVDKPPAALWLLGLSVRVFGLNPWAVLVPQALLGVASVWLVFATVRRWFSAQAGLIAGLVLAVTPVATLMFRFNNPDALLVLLLVAAAYAVTRAVETGSWRWLVLAGMFVGFGFLTKMLQALLVLPGFVAAYAVAAPVTPSARIRHLLAACAAMVASAGWWVAAVALWPVASRPFIGGSQRNSIVELILGYNGFGRLTGDETGSVVPGGGTGSMWGQTGWGRLSSASYGGQVAWLLPAALLGFAVMLWVSRRAPRTDRVRAAALIWGGWLAVTAAVISFSRGIIHEYYTVALAPAIGVGVGVGSWLLWQRREQTWARWTLAAAIAGSAACAIVLLQRSPEFAPWLSPLIGALGLSAAVGVAMAPLLGSWLLVGAAAAAMAAALAGPLAYSIQTVGEPATGSLPSAGPVVAGTNSPGAAGRPPGLGAAGGPGAARGGQPPAAAGFGNGAVPVPPWFGAGGGATGTAPQVGGAPGAGGGGAGGLLQASEPSAEVTAFLLDGAQGYRWVLATTGAQSAAGYQIATEAPVMAIGGFNGTDPAPTLEQFQALVAAGEIHYYLAGGGMAGPRGAAMGGSQSSSEIESWVVANYGTVTVGGATFYDLSTAAAA